MNTDNIGCLRWHGAISCAALGVFAFAVGASAVPLPKDPPAKKALGTREGGQMKPVTIYDDATKARGGASTGGASEATVFLQDNDSGLGWFMKSDDVFGYGTWASEMIFGNGFSPGDSISSYRMRFVHSSSDDPAGLGGNDAHVSMQLWDGDPFSIMDTNCRPGGVSSPIPGTQALFTGIPYATLADLTVVLPATVAINCDRVWGEMTILQGCRGAWRLAGNPGSSFNAPATIGSMNAVWMLWACEQFGACATANGYNSGFCCNEPGTPCDHTDGVFECDVFGTAPGALPTFCGDGSADYFVADYHDPGVFKGYVSSISAPADTFVSLVNVSVDAPPVGIVAGNDTLILSEGNHNIWQEFRIGNWDPGNLGTLLASWQITFDSASYTTGDHGALMPYVGSDSVGGGCTPLLCSAELGPGALCDPPGYFLPPGTCSFAFIDQTRPDFVYATAGIPIVIVDLTQPDFRAAGTVIAGAPTAPVPFPAEGLYAGTLTTHVPADVKGCFTITLKPFPDTQLVNQDSLFIPLVGIKSAEVCVVTGRCCFCPQDPGARCVDQLMTEDACAQMPGDPVFTAGESCPASGGPPCPTEQEVCPDFEKPIPFQGFDNFALFPAIIKNLGESLRVSNLGPAPPSATSPARAAPSGGDEIDLGIQFEAAGDDGFRIEFDDIDIPHDLTDFFVELDGYWGSTVSPEDWITDPIPIGFTTAEGKITAQANFDVCPIFCSTVEVEFEGGPNPGRIECPSGDLFSVSDSSTVTVRRVLARGTCPGLGGLCDECTARDRAELQFVLAETISDWEIDPACTVISEEPRSCFSARRIRIKPKLADCLEVDADPPGCRSTASAADCPGAGGGIAAAPAVGGNSPPMYKMRLLAASATRSDRTRAAGVPGSFTILDEAICDLEEMGACFDGKDNDCDGLIDALDPDCEMPLACGDPNASSCCVENVVELGCNDPDCCAAVCEIAASCCTIQWSVTCFALAQGLCPGLCSCNNLCGDINGDLACGNGASVNADLLDFALFANCFDQQPNDTNDCLCSDLDGNGQIDIIDHAILVDLFEKTSEDSPPNCLIVDP